MAADAIAMAGRPRLAPAPATAEVIDRFRAALSARDIVPPESIIADGSIHRCDAAGKNGKGDAAYLLHLDGIPAGGLENWRDGRGWESWRFDIGRALTPAERDALRRKAEVASARWMWPSALNTLDCEFEAGRPEDCVQRRKPRIAGR